MDDDQILHKTRPPVSASNDAPILRPADLARTSPPPDQPSFLPDIVEFENFARASNPVDHYTRMLNDAQYRLWAVNRI